MEKNSYSLIMLLSIFILGGCDPVIYVPDASEYIEWNGSYFYYGNYRCKTNLEDEEIYLNEIEYEDNVYPIDGVYNFKYVDNKLHMSFYIDVEFENGNRKRPAYVIYSIDNEEVEYLYLSEYDGFSYETDLYRILEVKDTYTIFASKGRISKLDLTLNEIEYIECESYEVKNGYAAIKNNNDLLISTLDDFSFNKIMSLDNMNKNFHYYIYEIDNRPFLQMINQTSHYVEGNSILVSSITYYDFEIKEFSELLKFEDNKCLSIDTNKTDTFILGEETYIEYNPYTSDDKHLEYKSFRKNNALYTVILNENNKLELKELYSFENDDEYNINKIEYNIIQLRKRTLNKPINHVYYNRIDTSNVYFDIDKLDFISKDNHDYNEKINLYKDSNYSYYIKTKKETSIAYSNVHYYLFLLDLSNNKEGLLAYFDKNYETSKCPMFKTYFIDNIEYSHMKLEVLVK